MVVPGVFSVLKAVVQRVLVGFRLVVRGGVERGDRLCSLVFQRRMPRTPRTVCVQKNRRNTAARWVFATFS